MQLPDFLTAWPDEEIVLTGHRIGLEHVVHFYNEGFSPEMLAEQFPTLPLSLIHKVIAYYLDNKADVDQLVKKHQMQIEEQRTVGRHPDWAQLRQRFEKLQQTRLQKQ